MKIIDAGHQFALSRLDGSGEEILTFVKREGDGYPGNVGHHSGTNLQEVLRAQIARVKYVDNQIPHWRNRGVLTHLRMALESLEHRAAERHHRILFVNQGVDIEDEPFCGQCGHIGCNGECQRA